MIRTVYGRDFCNTAIRSRRIQDNYISQACVYTAFFFWFQEALYQYLKSQTFAVGHKWLARRQTRVAFHICVTEDLNGLHRRTGLKRRPLSKVHSVFRSIFYFLNKSACLFPSLLPIGIVACVLVYQFQNAFTDRDVKHLRKSLWIRTSAKYH